jgi:hypothetical protein
MTREQLLDELRARSRAAFLDSLKPTAERMGSTSRSVAAIKVEAYGDDWLREQIRGLGQAPEAGSA